MSPLKFGFRAAADDFEQQQMMMMIMRFCCFFDVLQRSSRWTVSSASSLSVTFRLTTTQRSMQQMPPRTEAPSPPLKLTRS